MGTARRRKTINTRIEGLIGGMVGPRLSETGHHL